MYVKIKLFTCIHEYNDYELLGPLYALEKQTSVEFRKALEGGNIVDWLYEL